MRPYFRKARDAGVQGRLYRIFKLNGFPKIAPPIRGIEYRFRLPRYGRNEGRRGRRSDAFNRHQEVRLESLQCPTVKGNRQREHHGLTTRRFHGRRKVGDGFRRAAHGVVAVGVHGRDRHLGVRRKKRVTRRFRQPHRGHGTRPRERLLQA